MKKGIISLKKSSKKLISKKSKMVCATLNYIEQLLILASTVTGCRILASGDLLVRRHNVNEIVHKFLFAGEKLMSEMYLRQPRFTYSACGQFIQNKQLIQNVQDIFIEINWVNPTFSMTWLIKILRTCLEEESLLKYYVIKHLILLKN